MWCVRGCRKKKSKTNNARRHEVAAPKRRRWGRGGARGGLACSRSVRDIKGRCLFAVALRDKSYLSDDESPPPKKKRGALGVRRMGRGSVVWREQKARLSLLRSHSAEDGAPLSRPGAAAASRLLWLWGSSMGLVWKRLRIECGRQSLVLLAPPMTLTHTLHISQAQRG